jgi:hypothetical protein
MTSHPVAFRAVMQIMMVNIGISLSLATDSTPQSEEMPGLLHPAPFSAGSSGPWSLLARHGEKVLIWQVGVSDRVDAPFRHI